MTRRDPEPGFPRLDRGPEYEALCRDAERAGMHVGIAASPWRLLLADPAGQTLTVVGMACLRDIERAARAIRLARVTNGSAARRLA